MGKQNILLASIAASLILFSFTTNMSFGLFSSIGHKQIAEKKASAPMKYILTGGPGAGKTSILLKLEQLGHGIVREAATDVADLFIAQGHTKPWMCEGFNEMIVKLQSERQAKAATSSHERVFFDRSPLDVLAYAEKDGKVENSLNNMINTALEKGSYCPVVFLVENFGSCKQTHVRSEDIEEALRLQATQENNYRANGFHVVKVPPGPVEERANFILNTVAQFEKAPQEIQVALSNQNLTRLEAP